MDLRRITPREISRVSHGELPEELLGNFWSILLQKSIDFPKELLEVFLEELQEKLPEGRGASGEVH